MAREVMEMQVLALSFTRVPTELRAGGGEDPIQRRQHHSCAGNCVVCFLFLM